MTQSEKRYYPIVGIGADVDDSQPGVQSVCDSYVEAIYGAGCIPLVIPLPDIRMKDRYRVLAERAIGSVDAFLLAGGNDVNAALYGEENMSFNGSFSEERDGFEIELTKAAARMRKPVLGICRGVQLLNVAMGGTLFQDIESQHRGRDVLMHRQKAKSYSPVHIVRVRAGSLLADLLLEPDERGQGTEGEDGFFRVPVNSFHHQAIKDTAPGFAASAFAPDGIAEAIEPASKDAPMHPFTVGVQWHPERMWKHHPHAERLFKQFAQAAGGN
jgi:putative glutamine amidotransferase